jgi:diadenosine tetraphosphatase ApaH/serine/threonine PP2A family protein phosphatase
LENPAMLIALFADIHANIEALEACLRHAKDAGAQRHVFLGDLVGYGASPQQVVDIIAGHAAEGAVVIKGNHDEAVEGGHGRMNESAQDAIDWTRGALSAGAKAFLAGLPLIVREDGMCFVHASADMPEEWHYVDQAGAARTSIAAAQTTYTFSGHVHDQALYFETAVGKVGTFRPVPGSPVLVGGHRRWLAIVGSAGQPRDRNPAAAYALFDTAQAQLTFHRVPYDHFAAARRIREAGLGGELAYRIEQGI